VKFFQDVFYTYLPVRFCIANTFQNIEAIKALGLARVIDKTVDRKGLTAVKCVASIQAYA
jgi:hypothetical protein